MKERAAAARRDFLRPVRVRVTAIVVKIARDIRDEIRRHIPRRPQKISNQPKHPAQSGRNQLIARLVLMLVFRKVNSPRREGRPTVVFSAGLHSYRHRGLARTERHRN